jgi:hypothetical protein
MKIRMLSAAISTALLVSACGSESPGPAGGAPTFATAISTANVGQVDLAVEELAASMCRAAVWSGIERGVSFQSELDAAPIPGATEIELADAVYRQCYDAFYDSLNPAELDWCGSGRVLSRNFFRVVEAGVELDLPSFSVVDLPLLRKAKQVGADLSDYEIELFTVEITSMAATSGFSRDWAAACRATL